MYVNRFAQRKLPRLLAFAVLGIAASLGTVWAADSSAQRSEQWAQHRKEWVRTRLDVDANRLEIKASQQPAWQAYASARTALAETSFFRPAQDADAATIAKLRADRAADRAQKLAVLADATTKLQGVLSPDQRKTLDQIVQHRHRWHGHSAWRHMNRNLPGDGQKSSLDSEPSEPMPSA